MAGATYFVTACTARRRIGLHDETVAPAVISELNETVGHDNLLIAVVMPDHVHALFRLGVALTLSQVIGRWKARTRTALSRKGISWQRGFFDRRVRESEPLESYALYIFLNPYRAGLIRATETWSRQCITDAINFTFLDTWQEEGRVRAEWLAQSEHWQKSLEKSLDD